MSPGYVEIIATHHVRCNYLGSKPCSASYATVPSTSYIISIASLIAIILVGVIYRTSKVTSVVVRRCG